MSCCNRSNSISGDGINANDSGADDDSTAAWASSGRDGSHNEEAACPQLSGGEGLTEGGRVPARDDAHTLGKQAAALHLQPAGGGDDASMGSSSSSSSSVAASATEPGAKDARQQQALKVLLLQQQEALKPLQVEVQVGGAG